MHQSSARSAPTPNVRSIWTAIHFPFIKWLMCVQWRLWESSYCISRNTNFSSNEIITVELGTSKKELKFWPLCSHSASSGSKIMQQRRRRISSGKQKTHPYNLYINKRSLQQRMRVHTHTHTHYYSSLRYISFVWKYFGWPVFNFTYIKSDYNNC
jgi:hypothetical protein